MINKTTSTILLVFCVLVAGCDLAVPVTEVQEIAIGALLPLTGDMREQGASANAALQYALAEINTYLESAETNRQIKLVVKDTQTDPEVAFDTIKELSEQGIKVVIGPLSNDALASCKTYADRVNLILISPHSGATSLKAADNVFRFALPDEVQASAIAALLKYDGIAATATLTRDDSWGTDLRSEVATAVATSGESMAGDVQYGTTSISQNNFTNELDQLSELVTQAIADYGQGSVAILLTSYAEGVEILEQAATETALASVPWYATSGFCLNQALSANESASAFAALIGLDAPTFPEGDSNRLEQARSAIEESLGHAADLYSINAYDALWVAVLSMAQASDPSDVDFLKQAVPVTAEAYNAASGRIVLDENGDRELSTLDFYTYTVQDQLAVWHRQSVYENDIIVPLQTTD